MSCRALGFGLEEKFYNKIIDSITIKHIKFKTSEKNNVAKIFYKKIISNGLQKF
jgi:predicted enzyme involved in methoxymalonyl-ACP biosynthesis